MCEYNRPYPVPFGQHPDDYHGQLTPRIITLPPEAWQKRSEELPKVHAAIIEQSVVEAADNGWDVHLYRSLASPLLGIALKPGTGPNVKIWEH